MAPDINTVKGRLASPTTSSARGKQRAKYEHQRTTAVIPTSTKHRRPSPTMDHSGYYQDGWCYVHSQPQTTCSGCYQYPMASTTAAPMSVAQQPYTTGDNYSGYYPTSSAYTWDPQYAHGGAYYPQDPGHGGADPRAARAFICTACGKDFPKEDVLKRHQKQHTKPNACDFCDFRTAESRDLHRHLWVHHPQAASQMDIPSPHERCPVPGCGYSGRRDNVARHRRTKHGHAS